MFDIGPSELLLIVIVAVVIIGPKDLPLALRTAGRWMGKIRKISGQFRAGLDTMIREAEMEEMEKKWRDQNERIMREHPAGPPPESEPTGAWPAAAPASAEARMTPIDPYADAEYLKGPGLPAAEAVQPASPAADGQPPVPAAPPADATGGKDPA